jgi:FkbH-like protein
MKRQEREIKCLVWDLDGTLWDGVLLEGDRVRLREGVPELLRALDERGILHSIASRNDFGAAMQQLATFGLAEYFLHPQISWRPKSDSVRAIADLLNIGPDAIGFVDDDPYERDELAASLPEVVCIDAAELGSIADMPSLNPRYFTAESRQRRSMYQAEVGRRESELGLPSGEFLASLGMVLTISEAEAEDLARVEELTVRTNQLNSTGRTYSHEQLESFRDSPRHQLWVARLEDRYGTYGTIGVALIETREDVWLVELLLMSCRIMSRGVGRAMLQHLLLTAAATTSRVRATFVRTGRNRMMYLTFKLAGFREVEREGHVAVLEHDLTSIDPMPDHVELRVTA